MHHMQLGFLCTTLQTRPYSYYEESKETAVGVIVAIQLDHVTKWTNLYPVQLHQAVAPGTSLNARVLVYTAGQGKTENPCFLSPALWRFPSKADAGRYLFRPMIWTMLRKRSSSRSKACRWE